jgi:xylan 1,4-beta-xylosidase
MHTTINKTTMILYASLLVLVTMCTKSRDTQSGTGGLVKQPVLLADPFVLKHQGTYYLYGTSGSIPDEGIPVYKSTDGANWEGPIGKAGKDLALIKGQTYGTNGFWAPEVFFHNNKFYMFYTANEHIAVATSDSPLGPFTQTTQKPLHDVKEIDPHVFVDDNGKSYLYFVRFENGNRIFGAELNDDWQSIKENTYVSCVTQNQDWEIVSGAQWPVTEAPAMLKHKNLYYMFYTANDFRSPAYNVGYSTSTSPLGPFTKYAGNPIVTKTGDLQGTGHCAFVMKGDSLTMFYHAHNSPQHVGPRRTVYSTCQFVAGSGGTDVLQVNANKQFPVVETK